MKIRTFHQLPIWKLSIHLTKQIYALTNSVPFRQDRALQNQIRRAIVSVSSNIVEGYERQNNNEFIRYLHIAKASLAEARNQLYIAQQVGYVDSKQFHAISQDGISLSRQIGGFIKYLERVRENKQFIHKTTHTPKPTS